MLKSISFLFLCIAIASCSNDGQPLPEFSATTLSGKKIESKDLKGKITVIKIWATWCGPCLAEIPSSNELVEHYRNDTNVVFLAITDDSKEKITNFLSQRPFNFQHITDAKEIKGKLHKGMVSYIPEHIVVDQNLNIVFDQTEPKGSLNDTLISVIDHLK